MTRKEDFTKVTSLSDFFITERLVLAMSHVVTFKKFSIVFLYIDTNEEVENTMLGKLTIPYTKYKSYVVVID